MKSIKSFSLCSIASDTALAEALLLINKTSLNNLPKSSALAVTSALALALWTFFITPPAALASASCLLKTLTAWLY